MRNTLTDLNNYLFESLERLNDDNLNADELEVEIARSKAVVGIADKIIDNSRVALETIKHMDEYGRDVSHYVAPMLMTKNER